MQNMCCGISTHGIDVVDHGEVFVPAGKGRITFVDSRDVAAVTLEVFRDPPAHENEAYTLTGPERLSFDEVADILSEVLGYPVRYTSPSLVRFWYRLKRRGVPVDVLGFMTLVYLLTRTGRNEPLTGELARLLGRPATGFRKFAEEEKWRWQTRTWT